MSTRADRLTLKQANVLFAVIQNGPVTPAAVAMHTLMTESAARASLSRLDARALVAAQHTGTFQRARAYVATERGRAALAAADQDAGPAAALRRGGPAICPNGHAMDEGLFYCPACGAYRPSASAS